MTLYQGPSLLWPLSFFFFQVGFEAGHIFTQYSIICCRSWFGLKQCKWLRLGSCPRPSSCYLPRHPLLKHSEFLPGLFIVHRAALASPTHCCFNLKHMERKERKGSWWEERWQSHTHREPLSHPVCGEGEVTGAPSRTSMYTCPNILQFLIVWLILTVA